MTDINSEVQIIFYSGYKGQETPRAIVVGAKEYPVEKILWRRRARDKNTGERHELFRCRVAGQEVTLKISPSGEGRILGAGLDSPLPQK
ncbi:MAG: hypothetical protein WBC70_15055 [Candidatus Aminicenantales bacterium]